MYCLPKYEQSKPWSGYACVRTASFISDETEVSGGILTSKIEEGFLVYALATIGPSDREKDAH